MRSMLQDHKRGRRHISTQNLKALTSLFLPFDFESNDNDDEGNSGDDSFAVLVSCYSPGCREVENSNNVLLKSQNRRSKRSRGQFD
ncbi:hypothetical protein L195_g043718 [Trifolium pratense]|uniref:Uncharacterized protein n=1 Tax=Trifolium pratense TaxID=57577 RepID=A0A2K3MA08_TRIPR|nr:hypothetical protein L195_g043718 [Trifolium pratense]